MGVRENKVEKYLDQRIVHIGGITRKWKSPGVDGVPDRICFLPYNAKDNRNLYQDQVIFVEVKTVDDDSELSVAQQREHKRLRDAGADVTTVYGAPGVDLFMQYVIDGDGDYLQEEYR